MKHFFSLKKISFVLTITSCLYTPSMAQFIIGPGSHVTSHGNTTQIVAANTNLVNHGTINHTSGIIKFTGDSGSSISGAGTLAVYKLQLAKSPGVLLTLSGNIGVRNELNFVSGYLDLNGFEIDLFSSGSLINESESHRIIGANGGKVKTAVNLNSPNAVNPGNLGAILTSAENMGTVVIQRGHQSQLNDQGTGTSIFRYYDINPANNFNLKATLRFKYFDGELNGINESGLVLFKGAANGNWDERGYTTRDAALNYVEKVNIPGFSRWTLANTGNILASSCPGGLPPENYYRDADGDGYGNSNNTIKACIEPAGYVTNKDDCNDDNASVSPGALEICGNTIDENCNGQIDERCNTTSPALTINNITVYEAQGTAQLTVSLSAPAAGTVKVKYKTQNGTAGHPKDYLHASGELVFAPGITSQLLTVMLVADRKIEADEYFDVVLSAPVSANIAEGIGRVTVTENRSLSDGSRLKAGLHNNKKALPFFDVLVSSNPTSARFRLQVESSSNEIFTIQISNAQGIVMERFEGKVVSQPVSFGKNYRPGIYFARVIQGNNIKTVKLVKF